MSTTNQLITNAFYSSGVVSRDFETLSGPQLYDGLEWLNDIIGEKVVDEGMIPYETTYNLNSIIGQESYFIENLIQINTLTFLKDNVRYSMRAQKRDQYFGSGRIEGITSLPYCRYAERGLGGSTLYIYFGPDQAYPLEIHGIFRLSEISLGQDLNLTLDRFYQTYLRYALSDRICAEYDYKTPDNVRRQLSKYEAFINKKSRVIDMRMNKISTLQSNNTGINWAYVNLSQGFTTP